MRKKFFVLLLVLAMMFVASCGTATGDAEPGTQPEAPAGGEATSNEATSDDTAATVETTAVSGDLVTLEVFSMPATTTGLQANTYWTEILARDVGVEINLQVADIQRLTMLMSAGSLPDVIVFNAYSQVADAIAANLLLQLDDHQEALNDAFTNFPTAVQYIRDNVSNGTGNVFVLPTNVLSEPLTSGSIDFGPYIRWDLYQEIGAPPLNTWEDLLPTLRAMQDLNPTNEHGQSVYAISEWTDWDDDLMSATNGFASFYGHRQHSFAVIDLETLEISSIFDSDSLYRRYLQFLFDANHMGMLDPDTMTQGWEGYLDKASAGRVLFNFVSWGFGTFGTPERAEAGIGFMPAFIADTRINRGTEAAYVGGTWVYGIGADTNNMDAALRFVNYMYSAEGNWNLRFGERGLFWDADEEGPFITEFGFDMLADSSMHFPNGGRVGEGRDLINAAGPSIHQVNPLFNISMSHEAWPRRNFAPPLSNLILGWEADTGMNFLNLIPDLREKGFLIEGPFAPMAPISEADDATRRRVGDFVQVQSWLIAYATDEAEFDSLWNDMVDRAYGMGAQSVIDAFGQSFEDGVRNGAAYMSR